jgi:hypothetical protein
MASGYTPRSRRVPDHRGRRVAFDPVRLPCCHGRAPARRSGFECCVKTAVRKGENAEGLAGQPIATLPDEVQLVYIERGRR